MIFVSSADQAAGISKDWVYGVANIKYSYTVELGQDRFGFLAPVSQIEPIASEFYAGLTAMAQEIHRALQSREN